MTWEDYDEKNKRISINKTAGCARVKDKSGKLKSEVIINAPKTRSGRRVIPLSKKAIKIIESQKGNQSLYIFASLTGTILRDNNIRREMEYISKNINIKTHLTPHVLRHSFTTRMIEKGANIKALSEILGHAKVQMTLDIYTDVMQPLKDDTINLLND